MTRERSRSIAPKTRARTARLPAAEDARAAAGAGEIVEQGAPALPDMPIPLTSRAIFWQPRHPANSPLLVHVPFLFWLVETARPARVVQLGLGDAVGFKVICQAVDKLGLEAVCMALDAQPEGKPAWTAKDQEEHDRLYGDFSFVVSEDLGRAARHMQGGQIDLLLIDMAVDDSWLAAFRGHWEPLLSDRAVIVLLDPDTNLRTTEAREHFERLQKACPSIVFPNSQKSLDTVLLGADQPDRLRRFAELEMGMPGYLAARQVFARLGQGLYKEQEARSRSFQLNKANVALKDAEARIETLEKDLAQLRADVAAAQTAEQEQVEVAALAQTRIHDLTRELEDAAAENERLSKARTKADETAEALRKELGAATAQMELLDRSLAEATDALDTNRHLLSQREAELAELQQSAAREAGALNEQLAGKTAELEQLRMQIARRDAALRDKAVELEAAEEARQALETNRERQGAEILELTRKAEEQRQQLAELQEAALARGDADDASKLSAELDRLRSETATQIAKRDAALRDKAVALEAAEAKRRDLEAKVARQRDELRMLTERAGPLHEAPSQVAKEAPAPVGAGTGMFSGGLRPLASVLRRGRTSQSGHHMPSIRKQVAAITESPLFDGEWYARTYPDCGSAAKAARHYVIEGAFVGNDPGPDFSTTSYYQRNPDVADSGWPALSHYVFHGRSEGRAFDASDMGKRAARG